uniref:nucleoside-diphosphate kinase n=1 Tax=Caenorhabditis tropicalis TaxID=1561998 RepID=A0A1I7U903_9PELO
MDYCSFLFQIALSELRKNGIEIEEMRQMRIDGALAKRLYQQHEGKFFYDRLVRHISSGEVIAMRVNGNARKCIGSSRLWPRMEPQNQPIRQRFALSDVRNVAHASDEDVAENELKLFKLL